jgi:DNA-binding transcriptional ArsR family regulator
LIPAPKIDLIYQAIAHHTRREILNLLKDGPKAVSEIAACFSISQPAISQQLRILTKASLVSADNKGRQRIYRATPNALREVRAWISRAVTEPSGHLIVFRGRPAAAEQ